MLHILALASATFATVQVDTPRTFQLDAMTVIAHRTRVSVRQSAASASIVDSDQIRRLGARTLPDVLDYLPGLTFIDRDGAGELPMVIARGFFGGGETDHALLLIDGIPASEGRTGLIEWTQMPASLVERIEVLRGPGSAVYGDAALGAVINVVTRRPGEGGSIDAAVSAGSWGGASGYASARRRTAAGTLTAIADVERAGGWRERSRSSRLNGRIEHRWDAAGREPAYVRLSATRLQNEDPGPLPAAAFAANPRGFNPLFADDERTRDAIEAAAGLAGIAIGPGRLSVDARLRNVEQGRVRTLPVTPTYGDTQRHDENEWSLWTRTQLEVRRDATVLAAGIEAASSRYTSHYFEPDLGASLGEADGGRDTWSAYAEAELLPSSRVRVHGGLRFDHIASHGGGRTRDTSWSPRLGVNVAYSRSATANGNAWVMVTRSFKAPSLDQLYDERDIRAFGTEFNVSNPELKPQRAVSVETGLMHSLRIAEEVAVEASLSLYDLALRDEIDFDLATFRYGNILRSRHRGIELGLGARLPAAVRFDHALTFTRAQFAAGDHEGNRLKNIPGLATQTSVSVPVRGATVTLGHRWTDYTWLDDANTERLESPAMLDATVAWSRNRVGVTVRISNVTDAGGASLGGLLTDPVTGLDERLLYPVAGRAIRLTVSVGDIL